MSNNQDKIPEEIELWIKTYADKIAMDGHPSISTHIYAEVCTAMEEMYRRLSQQQGPRWVKVSEKLPVHKGHWNTKKYGPHDNEFPTRMNGKYFMANIFDNRLGGDVDPVFTISMNRHEYGKEYFDQIEWLDESPSPVTSTQEEKEHVLPVTDLESEDCSEEIDIIHFVAEQYGNGVGWLPMINKLRAYADNFHSHTHPVTSAQQGGLFEGDGYFRCQREIEMNTPCNTQCDHCREYFKELDAPKVDREKERAIAFAKWVLKGGWEIPNSNHEYQDLWTDQGHRWPVELKTSDELYDLFLQSQNKYPQPSTPPQTDK